MLKQTFIQLPDTKQNHFKLRHYIRILLVLIPTFYAIYVQIHHQFVTPQGFVKSL